MVIHIEQFLCLFNGDFAGSEVVITLLGSLFQCTIAGGRKAGRLEVEEYLGQLVSRV